MGTPLHPDQPEGNNFVDVEIDVRVQQRWYSSQTGQMQLRESFVIPASSFTELSKILGQFHDLANSIGKEVKP